ncbi:prephenate dehydratase [Pseudonocardiaceae bacterium YIM PH 21723]|nr:prephenate dehydratase [Pseudonocardiaceae bacterium YIM PH 21723]
MPRIAFLGPEGTFAEQAAQSIAADAELIPAENVASAIDQVRTGQVDAACVPVENSMEGSVPATLDALVHGADLIAVREIELPVRFSVLTRDGVAASDVRTVISHPHAIAQVRGWLTANLPGAEIRFSPSTAAAAVAVRDKEADAAVCAPLAAQRYGLAELATGVHDVAYAVTRFWQLTLPAKPPAPTGFDRTSIIVQTADEPGALAIALGEFGSRGISLTRIESRPTRNRLSEYRFFLDLEGHIAEARVADALAALRRRGNDVRFLGSYPRADRVAPQIADGSTDADFTAADEWIHRLRNGD